MPVALSELRKTVARRVKSYLDLEATDLSAGLTFQDNLNLVDDASMYRGAEILWYTGVNAGQRRRVIGSSLQGGTLTLSGPALPGSTAAGDKAGLFNLRNRAFRLQEIDAAINSAILEAHPHNAESYRETVSGTFDKTSPVISIPSSFTHVHRLEFLDPVDNEWVVVPKATYESGPGWYPELSVPALRVNGSWRDVMNGKQTRISGRKRAAQLSLATDSTATDVEWLVESAVAMLIMSQRDSETAAFGQYKQNRIDALRVRLGWLPEADTVEVRP